MASSLVYHIVPTLSGEWAIKNDDNPESTSLQPTQGLAAAEVW